MKWGTLGAAVVAAAIALGCSSSDTGTSPLPSTNDAGTAVVDAGKQQSVAPPQAIFMGEIQTGAGKDCRDSGSLFEVGVFPNASASPPVASVPVKDGDPAGQGIASVACSVTAVGSAFAVTAVLKLTGATGGLFKIDGTFSPSGDQTNIHVMAMAQRSANSYEEQDRACVATYSEPNMGVAAGRVWATFECPDAVNLGDPTRACEIDGELRFENCTQ